LNEYYLDNQYLSVRRAADHSHRKLSALFRYCDKKGQRAVARPWNETAEKATVLCGGELMRERQPTKPTLAFKLEALRRIEAGENVSALARDLGIKRKLLYQGREDGPSAILKRWRP
jgi:hypothetical protein